jgi:hypothetical protein
MAVLAHQEARPRTTGEILDDAWRLYRDDAALLLALSGLFLVPAWCVVLLLLTQPFGGPGWLRALWPALAALLLPLTGLGAGACEEVFHLRTEGEPVSLGRCLRAARRRALNHLALQAGILLLPMIGLFFLVLDWPAVLRWFLAGVLLLLNLPMWVMGLLRHAVLTAGQKNLDRAWRLSRRAVGRQPGKAWLLAAVYLLLLACVLINLYLFLRLGLWAAEDLAGLDTAFVRLLLSPGNPVFLVILAGLTWWLLAPFTEAANYLFLVDARTRYEGLDLWYQIEQCFPLPRTAKVGAVLLALGGLLLTGNRTNAAQPPAAKRVQTIQWARQRVAALIRKMEQAEPYPGNQDWQGPLREAAERLDPEGNARQGRYRWLYQTADNLGKDRAADLKLLRDADARLAVIEESLQWQPRTADRGGARAPSADDIRRLVPPGEQGPRLHKNETEPPPKKERPVPRDKEPVRRVPVPKVGAGGAVGSLLSGLGNLCLFFFLTLFVAVLVIGIVLLVRGWMRSRAPRQTVEQGKLPPGAEVFLEEPDRQNVASLWRQSDELARAGRFLEAVRTLYLAVLALLHQAGLIRYERTKTNGEYADHLRRRGSPVHRPFLGLTGLFELKWYGQRPCQADDYQASRGLAEEIQAAACDRPPQD